MKVINIADIRFAFESELNIQCKDEMALFEVSDTGIYDFLYKIKKTDLPVQPKEIPVFKDGKTCVYEVPGCRLIYYRIPNKNWNFCLYETNDEKTLYVVPENAVYVENMWNVFDKIEFSTRLIEKRAVMLHSSYIIYNGMAILFSAPCCVGKSTQARLWNEILGAEIVNGDRSVVREKDGQLYAFGTPFNGTSQICKNKTAPVRAIVALQQGKENIVRKLSIREAVKLFYSQTTIRRWNKEDSLHTLELWSEFMKMVPVLHLSCRPDEDAVYTLKNYLDLLDREGK